MPLISKFGVLIATWLIVLSGHALAQDVADPQPLVDRVVFAQRDVADQKLDAERRRVDALGERAQQQAILIAQQSANVRQLAGEVQSLKSERQLTHLAETFDSAIASGQWSAARTFLADVVALDSIGEPGLKNVSADQFIASLPAYLQGKRMLPRSNQEATVSGDAGVVTADGFAGSHQGLRSGPLDRFAGKYDYHFTRKSGAWEIDGITFRPSTLVTP